MRGLLLVALIAILPALVAAACSEATAQSVNPVFHAASAPKWAELSDETEFRRFRVAHVAGSVEAYPAEKFSGRGVVMTAGSNQEVSSAYVAIQKLRATGNALPVELFHSGVIGEAAQTEFEAVSGVSVRSVATSEDAGLVPSAMLQSSFAEVLLLSARTHALANPASVFETSEYARTGLVMWPALHKTSPANPIWSILNKECVDSHEQTAAAAVINKAKAWAALNVAAHLRGSFFQSMVNGDDSLLNFGALATNTEAHMAPASKAVGAQYLVNSARTFCAHSMVLASPVDASPLFLASAGAELAIAGSQGASLTCMQNVGEAVEHDESVVAELVRLQSTVPENSRSVAVQACSAGVVDETTYNTLVRTTYFGAATAVPTGAVGSTVTITTDGVLRWPYTANCGRYFSACYGYGSSALDTPTFFFNLTSLTRSSRVRVEAVQQTTTGSQLANYTLIRTTDNGQRRDECDYGGTFGPSYLYHNIVNGGYAVVAVAWDASKVLATTAPITIQITYLGASGGAFSSAMASLPLVLLAIVAAFVAPRL